MMWTIFSLTCACAAAVRGMWSPCGLSMLSTFTPMSERARGRRYWLTVVWFVVGAVIGGAALGGIAALAAFVVGAVAGVRSVAALGVLAVAFVIGGIWDLGFVQPALPHHRRQVNETWLRQFRRWFTASAFGAQIGFGFATYIMTAGVYLTVLCGALSGDPTTAFAVGVSFGATRGALVLVASRITTPTRLMSVHQRIEALREPVRIAVASTLVACGVATAIVAIAGHTAFAFLGFVLSFAAVAIGGWRVTVGANSSRPAPRSAMAPSGLG